MRFWRRIGSTVAWEGGDLYLQRVSKNDEKKEVEMEKWICTVCGYTYDPVVGDPDNGIEAGTAFENLPDTWICPDCGVGKELFEKEG